MDGRRDGFSLGDIVGVELGIGLLDGLALGSFGQEPHVLGQKSDTTPTGSDSKPVVKLHREDGLFLTHGSHGLNLLIGA
jgi:hypothetical protein